MQAFKCPYCAGDVKYDPHWASMRCIHCGSEIQREAYQKYLDENALYVTKEMVCPQCGAALLRYDDTLASFCCYCGSAVHFKRRLVEDGKPERIVPFKLTETEALARWRERLSRTVFTPGWLDEGGEERLVGVYMPYYEYSVSAVEHLSSPGQYLYEGVRGYETFQVNCEMTAEYREIRFDAAQAFPDHLSAAIDDLAGEQESLEKQAKPFETSYLAGYYADGGSVREEDYRTLLEQMVRADLRQQVFRYESIDLRLGSKDPELKTEQKKLLYPVWLNTHRRKERVCYAVIDGYNGNVAAELPIDWGKFLKIALLLSAVFFVVLNLFWTIQPLQFLCVSGLLLIWMGRLLFKETRDVQLRKEHLDDVGKTGLVSFQQSTRIKSRKKKLIPPFFIGLGWILLYGGIVLTFIACFLLFETNLRIGLGLGIGVLLLLFGGVDLLVVNALYKAFNRAKGTGNTDKQPLKWLFKLRLPLLLKAVWRTLLGAALAALILFINPVEDAYYYLGGLLDIGLTVWSAIELIRQHNLLASREIPVFTRKRGGDWNA
jgi:hypothetical protein